MYNNIYTYIYIYTTNNDNNICDNILENTDIE